MENLSSMRRGNCLDVPETGWSSTGLVGLFHRAFPDWVKTRKQIRDAWKKELRYGRIGFTTQCMAPETAWAMAECQACAVRVAIGGCRPRNARELLCPSRMRQSSGTDYAKFAESVTRFAHATISIISLRRGFVKRAGGRTLRHQ